MKHSEAQEFAGELRTLADFIEKRGHMLPGYVSAYASVGVYINEYDYEDGKSTVNEPKTKANLKRFLRAIGSADKDYSDDRLTITRMFGKRTKVTGDIKREIACKKVVTGQKLQEAVLIPARLVDIVEWECDETSLLAIAGS